MLLYTNESTGPKPTHYGPLTIKVWRADGHVESVTCQSYSLAFDVLDLGAPVERWEIHGEERAPMKRVEETWYQFGKRLASMGLHDELPNYQWLSPTFWRDLNDGFYGDSGEELFDGKPYPHFDTKGEVDA